jgi:hypothetical protein
MAITKLELKNLIREALREELSKKPLQEAPKSQEVIDQLLASKLYENKDFEQACFAGDAIKIMQIIDRTMEEYNLYTTGARKLRNKIFYMTRGNAKVSSGTGISIFSYITNSILSAYDEKTIGTKKAWYYA